MKFLSRICLWVFFLLPALWLLFCAWWVLLKPSAKDTVGAWWWARPWVKR